MDTISEHPITTVGLSHWLNVSDVINGNFSDELLPNISSLNISIVENKDGEGGWETNLILGFKALIMGTIIIVALLGNALVIVSISMNRKLQVLTNYFLVSLAIADMLVALCAMTFYASVELSGKWLFGYIMCDLWNSFDVYFSTVSILHLCCISMDRYYAILNPLEYPAKMTKRIVLIMLAHVWFAPTLISFLPIFLGWYTTSDHLQDRSKETDSCTFEVNKVFAILSSAISFWIPCTVMIILYYRIYQEARKQETAILSRTNSMSTLHTIHRGISPSLALRRLIARIRPSKGAANIFKAQRPKSSQDLPMCPLSMGCNKRRDRTLSIYSTTSEIQVSCNIGQGTSPCRCNLSDRLPIPTPSCIVTAADDDPISPSSPVASIHGTLMARDMRASSLGGEDAAAREASLNNGNSEQSYPSLSSGLLPSSTRNSSTCHQLMIPVAQMGGGVPVMRREHKAAKTLGIVMGAFILCWLPFFIWYVTVTICGESCPCPQAVITTLFWIGYFNSTLNPFIYAYFRRDFREAFKKTLRRLQCCFDYDSYRGAYV